MVYSAYPIEKFRFNEDDYEVVSVLGAGGMGTVYKARHKSLARFVAIKMMNATAGTDVESVARLKREAAAAAQIVHPNVIKVHSIGLDSDTNLPFIVMEYLEGESLASILERCGRLSEPQAVPIFERVLDALSALHDAGLVHRDVKPHNVFVTTDGGIKLMDLGIVKSVNGEAQRLTQTGTALGSPAYMSPEQCSGQADLDARSDLYSVGCALFRTLSGGEPFKGETALELMFLHLHEPPPCVAGVSPHVSATIAKAMQKDRANRFSSAKEFKSALLAGDAKCGVPPLSRPTAREKHKRLSPRVVASAAAMLCVFTAGALYARSHEKHSQGAQTPAYIQRLYHRQEGRPPCEVLTTISDEIDRDATFRGLSQAGRSAALRPVVEFATKEIRKASKEADWDQLFPLQIALGRIVAWYDSPGAYHLIREALDENRKLDLNLDDNAQWGRLSCNYTDALACLEARHYKTEFEELFAEFLKLAPGQGTHYFRNKQRAAAYLVAADYQAHQGNLAAAESMARKAIELRKQSELDGTLAQLEAYEKLCQELYAQHKWSDLLLETDEGWAASKKIMDTSNDRYAARLARLNMARWAVQASLALGDKRSADRFRKLEQLEASGSDIHRRITI